LRGDVNLLVGVGELGELGGVEGAEERIREGVLCEDWKGFPTFDGDNDLSGGVEILGDDELEVDGDWGASDSDALRERTRSFLGERRGVENEDRGEEIDRIREGLVFEVSAGAAGGRGSRVNKPLKRLITEGGIRERGFHSSTDSSAFSSESFFTSAFWGLAWG